MKASKFIVPVVFTFAAGFAFADDEFKDFDKVDKNSDGLLSIQEAREAFPNLKLGEPVSATGSTATGAASGAASTTASASASADGMLTRDMVKKSLPEISFQDNDRGPVTEREYDMIVEHMEEKNMTASSEPASASAAASISRSSTSSGSTGSVNQTERSSMPDSQSGTVSASGSASGSTTTSGAAGVGAAGGVDSNRSASPSASSPSASSPSASSPSSTSSPSATQGNTVPGDDR